MRLSSPARNLTLAVTGASGAVLAREILRAVEADSRVEVVNWIVSDGGLRVLAEELEITGRSDLLQQVLGAAPKKTKHQSCNDIGANIASGSYPTDAMIVLPCSVGTLGRIANGFANNLIERAADACLKEQRPLILCVRVTPFNKVHIRNKGLAADAGATIFPVMPTFYNQPQDSAAMARQFIARVLAHVGLEPSDMYRWKS